MKVLELFAGIGACSKSLTNLGIEHEIVDAVEIDKFAISSFNAIHGTNFEPQNICEWDKDVECDLIMHGSPCQDFSVAGKNAGGDEGSGTRSSLLYESLRIIEKTRPKYVIWENVKNLLSKKHFHNFQAYLDRMANLGYINSYQVLNAKDYGVPQNRERVFTVSIREDIWEDRYNNYKSIFEFPKKQPLQKRLKDILEAEVDEKYYLSEDRLSVIYKWEQRQKENGRGFRFEVKNGEDIGRAVTTSGDRPCSTNYIRAERVGGLYDTETSKHQAGSIYDTGGVSPALSTMQGGNQEPLIVAKNPRQGEGKMPSNYAIKTANRQGYDIAKDGDSIDLAYPNSTTRRGRVGHGVSKTLACADNMATVQNYRIRKLTPKECWRLMGFSDEDFNKAAKVNSNTQLYKQAGNSIVVNVIQAILEELLCQE